MLVMEEAEKRFLVRVTRSSTLASLENTVGPSVAGSVEYSDEYGNLSELIERSMGKEVEEELGLSRQEYRVHPLAYAREIVRGNRPQLFAVVETPLSRRQMVERISALSLSAREFSAFEFVPLDRGRLSQSDIAPLNFEAKMCYYLWEEWFDKRH